MSLFAQTITVMSDNKGCYPNFGCTFTKNGTTNLVDGNIRDTYQTSSACLGFYSRIIYTAEGGGRWELQTDLSGGSTFSMTRTDYANTFDSYPDPPCLYAGSWTAVGCGGAIMSITGACQTVLPVELVSFSAITKGNKTHLIWSTASEINNKGFEIERGTDGTRFERIGFVEGKSTTTSTQFYIFEDNTLYKGYLYYRLKQLDFDGGFEYSKIIAVRQDGKNEVSVFPNPSNGIFTITGLDSFEEEEFRLLNSIGQKVSVTIQHNGQLDLSASPSGVYYLRVTSNGNVIKLVKD